MARWSIAASVLLLLATPFGPGSCSEAPDGASRMTRSPVEGWPFVGTGDPGAADSGAERASEDVGVRLVATLSTASGPFTGRLFPNHCVRVQLSLIDRLGGPAPRDEDVLLEVTTSRPELAVFSDESCERVTSTVRIPWGFSSASLYVRSRDGLSRESSIDFRQAQTGASSGPGVAEEEQARAPLEAMLSLSTQSAEWTKSVLVSTRVRAPDEGGHPFSQHPLLDLAPSGTLYLSWSERAPSLSREPQPTIGMGDSAAAQSAPPILRFARSTRLWSQTDRPANLPEMWESLQPPLPRAGAPVFLRVHERGMPRVLLGWRRLAGERDGASEAAVGQALEFSTALLSESVPKIAWSSPTLLDEGWMPAASQASRELVPSGGFHVPREDAVFASAMPSRPSSLLLRWMRGAQGGLRQAAFDFESAELDESSDWRVGDVSGRLSRRRSSLPQGERVVWMDSVVPALQQRMLTVWKTVDGRGMSRLWGGGPSLESDSRRAAQDFALPLSSGNERVAEVSLATNGYDRVGVLFRSESAVETRVDAGATASRRIRGTRAPARDLNATEGARLALVDPSSGFGESLVFRNGLISTGPAGGRAWSSIPQVVESGGPGTLSEPVLAMDRRGQAYAAWVRRVFSGGASTGAGGTAVVRDKWELRFSVRGDRESAWDLPVTLSSASGGAGEISRVRLSVDASGNAVVAWVEGNPETGEVLRTRRMLQGLGWQPIVSLSGASGEGGESGVQQSGLRVRSYGLELQRETGFAVIGWMEESEDVGTFSLSLLR